MTSNSKVHNVTQKIVESLQPHKVILFGSHAQSTASQTSDIDLVIVYDGEESKKQTLQRIHNLFPHPDFSLDVFILRSHEFDRQINIKGTLGHEAYQTGIVIYE